MPRSPKRSGRGVRATRRPGDAAAGGARKARSVPAGQSAFELKDEQIERALQTDEHRGLLQDYFGPARYERLRQLARDASARAVRGGPKVLVLPGIMGSKIGKKAKHSIFDDVYWLDPIDVALGNLVQLALPKGNGFRALGVILPAYMQLKLRLDLAGYDAEFYAFDWRKSITDLGAELRDHLKSLGGKVSLVAHSMGGLVSRAAIAQGAPFERLVLLGTPNFGSYVPFMAIRGTDSAVQKIAGMDPKHTAEDLSRDVFSTFPGLAQMLPFAGRPNVVDLYDGKVWPEAAKGLVPSQQILDEAPKAQKALAPGDDRLFMIAGVEQRTVVGLSLADLAGGKKEFVYEYSSEGDGTVPLKYALLPKVKATYYVKESHGSLPNNWSVGTAVIDLLQRGETNLLPSGRAAVRKAADVERVPESQIREEAMAETRRGPLSSHELRHVLDHVAAPDARNEAPAVVPSAPMTIAPPVAPEAGYRHAFQRVVVGRRGQHRIDLRLAHGSITEASTRALALGVFRDVAPTGAALALDTRMGGAIKEVHQRRMFSANVGEIFVLPTGRNPIAADFIVLVGLGPFYKLTDEVLETAAENLVRTLVNSRVEEFGTVLFGGASGGNPAMALRSLMNGFFRGLRDADTDHFFRRIVLCERDEDRYLAIKEELYRLSSTQVCQNVELTFDEVVLQEMVAPVARVAVVQKTDPVYLIVRQEARTDPDGGAATLDVRSALLTAGAKATVLTGVQRVAWSEMELHRAKLLSGTADAEAGVALARSLLVDQVLTVLPRFREHDIVVVHDAPMSRIPWEIVALPGRDGKPWYPALAKGISHRYAADNLSVAKWLEERVDDPVFSMLLVVNPTGDLDAADEEGERIQKLFSANPTAKVTEIRGPDATRPALRAAFASGEFDVIHYAGHAGFDEHNPERSGLVCANKETLTGSDLAEHSRLPALVFFNACETGRIGGAKGKKSRPAARPKARAIDLHLKSVGLAEAFLRGGVANLLATYWPVGDAPAKTFATEFYTAVLAGKPLGAAITAGRNAIRKSLDWANYILYGNADFVVKNRST